MYSPWGYQHNRQILAEYEFVWKYPTITSVGGLYWSDMMKVFRNGNMAITWSVLDLPFYPREGI